MALDCTIKSLIFCLDKLSDKNEIEKVVYTEVMSPESKFFFRWLLENANDDIFYLITNFTIYLPPDNVYINQQ